MNQDETMNNEESMSEEQETQHPEPVTETTKEAGDGIERRDMLKGLAGIPVVGWLFWRAFRKKGIDDFRKSQIIDELGDLQNAPAILPSARHAAGEKIRIGIIGCGGEGNWLSHCIGFTHKWRIDDWTANNNRTAFEEFRAQPDLNLELTAVCDVYDVRADMALWASNHAEGPNYGKTLPGAKRYRHYQDMLTSGEIDAVIIATPDHWHSRMAIDAVNEGIPVYLEKAMTRTEPEARDLRRAVRASGVPFQLGHQNRQLESHEKARVIIEQGLLGPVNLIEVTTNRNSPSGAWVYPLDKTGTADAIDWELWQGAAPNKVPFSAERYFRWRCWFDYGTGLSGDLFNHEYDAINQILDLGIPETVTASGGIYFYKPEVFHRYYDRVEHPLTVERDVPDVFNVSCEYPDRNLTLLYSATLSSNEDRGKIFMGHDASMEVGANLTIRAGGESTRYREKIQNGIIDTSLPLFQWQQGSDRIDAVTSASDRYFLSRGLMYTFRGGQKVPTNNLHIAEWLDVIRNGGETSCNIDRGFEEAMVCHMATKSYLEKRQVRWDPVREQIV
ncbi:Gfo/Idh/MocA family protein [Candidatus Zixiibacteriota bacterium]